MAYVTNGGTSTISVTSTGSLGVVVQNQVAVTSTGSLDVTESSSSRLFPLAPISGTCFGFKVLSGSVQQYSLIDAEHLAIVSAISASKVFVTRASVDCVYRYSTLTSNVNIDEFAITGSVQCADLFAKERADEQIPVGTNSVVLKGTSTTLTGTFKLIIS